MRRPSLGTIARAAVPPVLAVVVNVATNVLPDGVRRWQWAAWPVALVLAVVTVWTEVRPKDTSAASTSKADFDDVQLNLATRRLAEAIRVQWSDEAVLRGLRRPQPLQLRWSATARPVAAPAATVLNDDTLLGHHARLRSTGDLAHLATRFRQLPHRQLVVLGEPGGGKSVLVVLLTLDLLERGEPGDPVPVPLSLASWNPGTEHLRTWMAARLVEDHPYLTNVDMYGPEAAARLLATGRVMPVLDGLDELPVTVHSAAIEGLDRAVAGGQPLVVACRTAEYQASIEASGRVLARAAVVEIADVDLDHAAAYLTSAGPAAGQRWEPVLARIAAEPDGPVARALRTPLMVGLAESIYARPATDPTELFDIDRFPDRAAVEQHLLQAFVPAAYHNYPPQLHRLEVQAGGRHYQPEQVRRWLTFLATYLNRRGTPDLAWWELRSAFRRPRLTVALLAGAVVGILVFAIGLGLGLASGLPTWPAGKILAALRADVKLASVPGLAAAVVLALSRPQQPNRAVLDIRTALAASVDRLRDRRRWGALVTAAAVTAGFVASTKVFPGFGHVVHVVLAVPGPVAVIIAALVVPSLAVNRLAHRPVNVAAATDPISVLRSDRRATVVRALVSALATSLGLEILMSAVGSSAASQVDLVVSIGVVVGLITALTTAWGNFQLARIWYGVRGDLPFSLTRFLADARRRSVLRQNGAMYQFRHVRLQEQLAFADVCHKPPTGPAALAKRADPSGE